MINDYLLYVTLAITVTALPGPAVVLTIKNSLIYGFKASIANIFGNFVAMVFLATLSAIGLGAIILTSATLFSLVKILGCVYLIYLGIKTWKSTDKADSAQHLIHHDRKINFSSVFKEGFGVGISNPKAIVFFTALFPQFIDLSREFVPQFLTLILTIEGISFVILTGYAVLASMASPYLSRENTMKMFNKLTGAAFIGFGAGLMYEK